VRALIPPAIDTSHCACSNGLTLLYTGISPTHPPTNGRASSSQALRSRIKTHYVGNAEGSTLRKTLGVLLAAEFGIELRRVGSGARMTFGMGEQVLSAWMAENAFVHWVLHEQPWELERELIASLDVPLNLAGNTRNIFHATLTRIRADAVARARELPILPSTVSGASSLVAR
jgi:hypothetical protein